MKRIENPPLTWDDNNQPTSRQFGDIYFHRKNGLDESRLVFLHGNNLPEAWIGHAQFTIAETGFGSGLNFLAAWELFEQTAAPEQRLDFISFEKYPLHIDDLTRVLHPWKDSLNADKIDRLLAVYPLRIPGFHRIWINDRVTLTLIFDDVMRGLQQLDCPIDAWFLDGFAPSKNPELWHEGVFAEMARLSHADTTLASFTSVGSIRRALQTHGFIIKREKGYGYKVHRITGRYTNGNPKTRIKPPQKVKIIGAGLAGAATAYALKRRGIHATIIEKNNAVAMGASGNRIGLINPKIEAQDNPRNDAGLSAYGFALHVLRDIQSLTDIDFKQRGALHLGVQQNKMERLQKLCDQQSWLEPHMQWVKADETQSICGMACTDDGVFYPDASSVHTAQLVKALLHDHTIQFNCSELPTHGTTIHANGWDLHNAFPQFPLQPVRGQVTYAAISELQMTCPVMFGSYLAPVTDGFFCLGATFHQNNDDPSIDPNDTQHNVDAVCDAMGIQQDTVTVHSAWANVRTASRDRFPIGGLYQSNCYISGALGSHGIQFSLLIAEIIACQLTGAPLPIGRDAVRALSPMRFASTE